MKIRILAIGKIKEKYLKEGINEYLLRIRPYCSIEIVEVNDEPLNDNPNNSEIEKAKNIEGQRVIKLLKPNDYLIGLDLNKKQPNSPEFAEFLQQKLVLSGSNLSFVIGGQGSFSFSWSVTF